MTSPATPTAPPFDGFTFDVPTLADVDGLYGVTSDPAVWQHSPAHRHTAPEQALAQLEDGIQRWQAVGLDYWIVHDPDGTVVGSAGARRLDNRWNLFARLSPSVQGRGLAAASQQAALAAAHTVEPGLPVVGRLRLTNDASRRLMERVGLEYQCTTPATDDGADWLVYADRPLDDGLRDALRA